jgi:2-isopropylmalate synthase
VTIQVLTQSRAELIRRTFDAIAGARRAIVHLYNSTSELQRRVVFGQDRAGIIDIAVTGAKLIGDLASAVHDTEIIHQYSPESFTGTECRSVEPAGSRPAELRLRPKKPRPIGGGH